MSEKTVTPQPPEADDGWTLVAEQMQDWHPDLRVHAERHLAMRGLLPEALPADVEQLEEPKVKPEVVGDPEKLKKGIKIVVGGPPHSGKSVFIEALTKNLDKGDTFAFSACPDGEGPWLQRHYDDPEVVKWRQKGQFTPEFVNRAKRVVDEWEGPLMLIDIGGRTSEENAQIVEGATHAVILADDLSKVGEWQEFFKSHGVEVMAVLHSHYHGNTDQVVGGEERKANPELRLSRLTASVHHLERGEPAEDRLTIKEVAVSIHALVENNTTYQEARETGETSHFVVDLPSFLGELPSEEIEKTLPGGKVVKNRQLQRAALPLLYEKVDKSFITQPVWLDGPINSWEAIALACAFAETDNPDIRMRGPDGFIKLETLPQQGEGDTIEWQVSQTGELGGKPIITVHAKVSASTRLVKPEELATMHIPEVPQDSIVIISTAGPNWLRSSIALGYKDHCSAIAAFQPGDGSTIAWSREPKAPLGIILGEQASQDVPLENYLRQAKQNLLATSRTAQGTIDTSASATKADSMVEITAGEASLKAQANFEAAFTEAYGAREAKFDDPDELRGFIEGIARTVNGGIVKDGMLIRSGEDSAKYPYTRIADLESAMTRFYAQLFEKMNDPKTDPVELAAWAEYHIDLTDHFFADGCGKTAKIISAFILMRKNLPLPKYTTRADYYESAPREITGNDPAVDSKQYATWLAYYRTLF